MPKAINPYLAGQPITTDHQFYGRQDLVETLVTTLTTTQQNAIVLHGQRRIGKSSLLFRLRRDETLGQAYLPIFFDLHLFENSPVARILIELAKEIVNELDADIPVPEQAGLEANYHQFERAFLPAIYPHLGHKQILFLFDEFDAAVPPDASPSSPTDTLLGYLRPLIAKEQQRLAFIFVVGQQLDLLTEGYQRLFKGGQAEPVGRLGQQDTYQLLTKLGRQGAIEYTDEALTEIWTLTNGHPYLTQLLGSEIFIRLQNKGTDQASVEDVTACLDKAMEHGRGGLAWFWNGFNREERMVLATVADLTNRQESISDTEIEETLRQHLLFLTHVERSNAYNQLIQGDFLLDTGRRHYKFAVEFIRRWIVKYHPLKELQRQIDQGNLEAQSYYQLGSSYYEKGDLSDALKNYRQALELNPSFSGPQLGLARTLRAQGDTQAAITEYEKAYRLDPDGAQEELIKLRLNCAKDVEVGDDVAALTHAKRILEIDAGHLETRQLLSNIYLRQAGAQLELNNREAALEIVQYLLEPIPIIHQDADVAQRVRELWLDHSHRLTQQDPPNWDEAQHALDDLESLDLLDDTLKTSYNQITLDKAHAILEQDQPVDALLVLQTEIKPPPPADQTKIMLLDYSRRQIEQQQWSQAATALEGLRDLVDDEECQTALQDLYHQWGDSHLKYEAFGQAIEVYRRGQTKAFKPKIAKAYLAKARHHLNQQEFDETEASYQQVLTTSNTKTIRAQIEQDLETYFNTSRTEQAWGQAGSALAVLRSLDLAKDKVSALQSRLYLDQAGAELEQDHRKRAFHYLALLGDEASFEIKDLIRTHLRRQARRGKWVTGAAILKRLASLLVDDAETTLWRANWLFIWAQALFTDSKVGTKSALAKHLCYQILDFAPAKTPLVDLLSVPDASKTKKAEKLDRHVCALAADISLAQAQTCLDQDNLKAAVVLFKEALNLPVPPKQLGHEILKKLETFRQNQWLKEAREQARDALQAIQELGLGDPSELMTSQDIEYARRMFKEGQVSEAFVALGRLASNLEAEQHQIKAMVYQFSLRYAGREHWEKARQTLEGLRKWLPEKQDDQEIATLFDDLNHERLDFTKGKHLATKPLSLPSEGIEQQIDHLAEELKVIGEGYEEAKVLGLTPDTPNGWAKMFIKTSLTLGQAHLTHRNLEAAGQIYQKALGLDSQPLDPTSRINRSLRHYSERMLYEKEWLEARQALDMLKSFNLPAPDGRTRPDPRVDGAIQRVILRHVEALLADDEVEKAFGQLQALPLPLPLGEIKQIIWNYSRERRIRDKWPDAIEALHSLNEFLSDKSETNDNERVYDQQSLEALVDGLAQWGQQLEKEGQLEPAADAYKKALHWTHNTAQPRNIELADHYIRVVLHLAQNVLQRDSLNSTTPPVIKEAIEYYQKILTLDECRPDYENQINQALYNHASKLTEARRWSRAHEILDYLDELHPMPRDHDKTSFATWRRELILNEVQTQLKAREIEAAFGQLARLKKWLDDYDAPKTTWNDSQGIVKRLICDFYQQWLKEKAWEPTVAILTRLSDLLPGDGEATGWEVEVHFAWGQSLQRGSLFEKALTQYNQALDKAPDQDLVAVDQIEGRLLASQLALAQQMLDQDKLESAETVYDQVLQKPGDHLERASKIRQALKGYSDHLANQTSPDWEAARQALEGLRRLNLDDSQVFVWFQQLILNRMNTILHKDNLDTALACLEAREDPWALERPWPWPDIQRIMQNYSRARVEADTWPLAVEALKRLGSVSIKDASILQWVINELMEVGELLVSRNIPDGAEASFGTATKLGHTGEA